MFDKTSYDLRNAHVALISGFPSRCFSSDIFAILEETSPKSVHIPRTDYNYNQRPWAYVAYASAEALAEARAQSFALNDRTLHWHDRNKASELCYRCGLTGHKHADCPNSTHPARRVIPDKERRLYEKFRPAGFKPRSTPVSY